MIAGKAAFIGSRVGARPAPLQLQVGDFVCESFMDLGPLTPLR
jgi:hypothetical protein